MRIECFPVPPSIDEDFTSSDLDVREGADVNFALQGGRHPQTPHQVEEEEDKDIILGSKRIPSVEGESLKLTRTSRLSMGAYLCIASNGVLPSVSKRIMLNVLCNCPYDTDSQSTDWCQPWGGRNFLVCNLESYPRSVTYWVIAGGHLHRH
ncbi:lachesin [Caerostris extrusa]|uniref:Lachesin n=1 Tax=Caerostris extrusa TaxID=172846 RepID=A0AAV4PGV6_CAEEX|nr:lachesin [Caerostris extrusa]